MNATHHDVLTAVYMAAQKRHREVAKLLLNHKTGVNASSSDDVTPLYITRDNNIGHRKVVKLSIGNKMM